MQVLGGIVVALLLLGIMVTLHELGHFLVGLKLGFKVLSFQIFIGPKLVEWERKGIKYRICLLPLGAAVQFAGEYDEGDAAAGGDVPEVSQAIGKAGAWRQKKAVEPVVNPDPKAFHNRPKSARAAVLLAGPAMNIITGILALFICFGLVGYTVPVLAGVPAGSQAAVAGLQAGDRILRLDDRPVRTDVDIASAFLFKAPTETTEVKVRRAGREHVFTLQPERSKKPMLGIRMQPDSAGRVKVVDVDRSSNHGSPVLAAGDLLVAINGQPVTVETVAAVLQSAGSGPLDLELVRDGVNIKLQTEAELTEVVNPTGLALASRQALLPALPYSAASSWSILKLTGRSVVKMVAGQLKPTEALSGPVGIVSTISNVVTAEEVAVRDKVVDLLRLFSLISLSLGFTNLLPIPLLDGNQLLLLGVEAIRGRRLSYRAQSIISMVGIVLIFGLFALAFYADLARLFAP